MVCVSRGIMIPSKAEASGATRPREYIETHGDSSTHGHSLKPDTIKQPPADRDRRLAFCGGFSISKYNLKTRRIYLIQVTSQHGIPAFDGSFMRHETVDSFHVSIQRPLVMTCSI